MRAEEEAVGYSGIVRMGMRGDDTDDHCWGTSPTRHHPVVPITCPKKSRAPHAENTALKVTEYNRDVGASS